MKGKLYKSPNGEHYYLTVNGNLFAEIGGHPLKSINQALSLKNCQAIANGYDLDELADYHFSIVGNEGISSTHSFKVGFQKAVEILGDKKFSIEDIQNAIDSNEDSLVYQTVSENGDISFCLDEDVLIQSLQQTEWDVTFNPDEKDADGCLILKIL